MSEKNFTKERSKICEGLMMEDVRKLLALPLNEKVEKSKQIIREAFEKYQNAGVGFSGGTDSLVLLHLILQIKQDMPIIFVNTGHQFSETYKFIEEVKQEWNLKDFREVKPEENKLEKLKEKFGFKTPEFTKICCGYHKIAPLMKSIGDFGLDAFIAGIRGVEHEERAKETIFSPRENHDRVHPLLFWDSEDILTYVKENNIKCNPLYAEGYTSLGCTHCTDKNTDPNAHERAGRGVVREEIMEQLRELGYT